MQIFRKQESTIGLDIGSSMIKAVKMTVKGKINILESYALEPIAEGAVQSGEIRDPSSLAQSTLNAVSRCDAHLKDVVIALPNYAILSDVLTMNLTPEKEMREAVMIEAEQMSAFDLNDVEIDYSVLERDETAKKMKVLMVVAKNDIILSYIDFLGEAGLRPIKIDVDLFALTNIFHHNYDFEKYKSCVLLNIGTESTVAAFLRNGIYHSSRDISVAGTQFLRELESVTDLTAIQRHNVLQGDIRPDLDPDTLTESLNNANTSFSNAVSVALSYFQASDAVGKIDLIVLTGGYAWVPGLINVLELRTGAEVIILDPFNKVKFKEELMESSDPKKIGTILSVAMGLAARSV
ncbi:MAG: type IV pilus assembly protein PilM [Candidatus Latescibacteria bacterium]|nr:type IV pilus assembly protein PilM [Candidatus Latescibacterota bacterium]